MTETPIFDHLISEWWPVLRETISSALLPGPKVSIDHPYDSHVRKLWAAS